MVIFCAKRDTHRVWTLSNFDFKHVFLKENRINKQGKNIHNNLDVLGYLKRFNPDIVITTGFNPTHLYSWFFAKLYNKIHIPMTDGWLGSETNLSPVHKIIRKIVFYSSDAFIGAGLKSKELFESYGIKPSSIFRSHLCIDNNIFLKKAINKHRRYHLMFSGQFIDRKMPLFFAEVVHKITKSIPHLSVLILGDGPLKTDFLNKLKEYHINYTYAGFISQEKLPQYYSSSKLFLFPTKTDAWGIVANEALASGTPVLVTPYAGIVDDLVYDGYNGFVMDPNVDLWSKKSIELLNDTNLLRKLSRHAILSVENFTFENAAQGIIKACNFAYSS